MILSNLWKRKKKKKQRLYTLKCNNKLFVSKYLFILFLFLDYTLNLLVLCCFMWNVENQTHVWLLFFRRLGQRWGSVAGLHHSWVVIILSDVRDAFRFGKFDGMPQDGLQETSSINLSLLPVLSKQEEVQPEETHVAHSWIRAVNSP